MSKLMVLVDYDNVELSLRSPGPVNFAKVLTPLISGQVSFRYSEMDVRLYGGWRSRGLLTNSAQRLVPDIHAFSPTYVGTVHAGSNIQLKLTVELADKPIGLTIPLEETLVKERDLRKFRTRSAPWAQCANPSACSFKHFTGLMHNTACGNGVCANRLGNLFVRDEQKMVDTLIVADIAFQVLSEKAKEIVIVSSDTDMWPGVLLALRAGCSVIHIHTKAGWTTQKHLIRGAFKQTTPKSHRILSYYKA